MAEFNRDVAVAFAKQLLSGDVLMDDLREKELSLSKQEEQRLADRNYRALEQAAIDPDTNDFDALVDLAADLLSRNERIPEFLAVFAADVLSGKRKRPTKRGADKYDNWLRDHNLWRATKEVAKTFGLPHYLSMDLATQPTQTTAADIVARAAGCKTNVVTKAYQKFEKKLRGEITA